MGSPTMKWHSGCQACIWPCPPHFYTPPLIIYPFPTSAFIHVVVAEPVTQEVKIEVRILHEEVERQVAEEPEIPMGIGPSGLKMEAGVVMEIGHNEVTSHPGWLQPEPNFGVILVALVVTITIGPTMETMPEVKISKEAEDIVEVTVKISTPQIANFQKKKNLPSPENQLENLRLLIFIYD